MDRGFKLLLAVVLLCTALIVGVLGTQLNRVSDSVGTVKSDVASLKVTPTSEPTATPSATVAPTVQLRKAIPSTQTTTVSPSVQR